MEEVLIKSFYEKSGRAFKGYLLDDTHAIENDGEMVHIFRVVPTRREGVYRVADPCNFIQIATSVSRSLEKTLEIVEQLKTMSAYTLLTQHYIVKDQCFDITKIQKVDGRI